MQFSTMIVGALAAIVSAAPVTEPQTSPADMQTRNILNRNDFNNFKFKNNDLGFLFGVQNKFDFNFIEQLVGQQFEAQLFAQFFQAQRFDPNQLFLAGQLTCLQNVHSTGLFNGFNLGGLKFNQLDWGFAGGFSGFDFNGIIGADVRGQINGAIQANPNIVVINQ